MYICFDKISYNEGPQYMVHIWEYVLQGATELQLQTWGKDADEMFNHGRDLAFFDCPGGSIVVSTEFGLFLQQALGTSCFWQGIAESIKKIS